MENKNKKRNDIIKKVSLLFLFVVIVVFLSFFHIKFAKAVAGSYIVNSTADTDDATPGDGICDIGGGVCTLRAAIEEANANVGADNITFDPTILPAIISPATDLPALTEAGTTISGPGISNLTIDAIACGSGTGSGHDAISIKASDVSVSGLTIENSCNNGVYVYGNTNLSNITVQNLAINNSYSNGIEFFPNVPMAGITGSTIANNTIDNSGTGGSADGIDLMFVDHTSVSGNTITNSANDGIEVSGESSYITISGNTVSASTNDGIAISGSPSGDDHDIINSSNNVTSNIGNGVSITDSDGTTISGNTFSSNGANGISLSNANSSTITGNTANNNTLDGISFSNSDTNTISGNTFSSNARGIRLYSADSNTITGNTVSSNTLDGISFSDSDNNQVSSNTFSSNGTGTSYQTNPNYISYDDGDNANEDNPMAYVILQANGAEKGANYLVDGNYSAIKNNGDPVAGLDGTQDLYLALITDDRSDGDNQYTFYTDKSQGVFLTWCQANVNALCNIDYYSSVPVWQHNGAYNNYTWNATALPSGMGVDREKVSSVSTSYYDASSMLLVNYDGSDYNQALLLGLGVPIVFYVGIPASSGAGVFNIMTPGLVNNVFGFDGTTDLDLLLLDDAGHGDVLGKSAWVVPNSIPTSSLIWLLNSLGDEDNSAIEVCREPSVFTGNGDGNDYTFKPIVSWTVCSGATMSDGFADPATMIGYPTTPPALDAGSGIYLQNSKSNTFTSNILTSNGNTYVISGTSNSNTFTDDVNTTPIGHDYEYSSSGNNTINNVDIAANGANGQNTGSGTLSVYYKARAFVHNGQNIPITSAPVSFKDSEGIERASDTTDINGYTAYHLLLSYTQTSTTFNSYNDYSVAINAPGYSSLTKNTTINSTNITVEAILNIPPAYSPPPQPPQDTTPPTDTSISINNGDSTTSSTNVNLTLGATDASQMIVSNSIDFVGSTWEAFNVVKNWALTVGDGIKTVYAKFSDLAGNVSAIVSDNINLTIPATGQPVIAPSPETTPTQSSTQDTSGTYDYQWIRQSDYPTNLTPGQVVQVWVEVKNTGTATWHSTGPNAVKLGTGSNWFGNDNQKQDYTSEVYDASWLGLNRAASFSPGVGPDLPPGYNTRFTFNIKAPSAPGTYKAYFTPVAEGITWMKDVGMYWEVTVGGTSSQPQ